MSDGHALWHVADPHPATDGHFVDEPIIPGAVLLREIVAAIGQDDPQRFCRRIEAAKFLHKVRPGDVVAIEWESGVDGRVRFSCRIMPDGPRVVTGALRLAPP